MLGPIFDISFKGMQELKRFAREAPRAFQRAVAFTLNHMAFTVRISAIHQIQTHMHVRNLAFVKSRIQVQPARFGPIASQHAIVGSVATNRFSGWIEQEGGRTPAKHRLASLVARGGSEEGKIKKSAWLGQDFVSSQDVGGNLPPANRFQALIRDMAKNAPNVPFLLLDTKGTNFVPGLYKIKPGMKQVGNRALPRITMLREFKKKKPKIIHWMQLAYKQVFEHTNMQAVWDASVKRALGKP